MDFSDGYHQIAHKQKGKEEPPGPSSPKEDTGLQSPKGDTGSQGLKAFGIFIKGQWPRYHGPYVPM